MTGTLSLPRRTVLKGLAAISALGGIPRLRANAAPVPPATLVYSGSRYDTRFQAGANTVAAFPRALLPGVKPGALGEFLAAHKGRTLVGLVSGSDFAIFQGTLREWGARFLAVGQHSRHHRFLTVPESRGVGGLLADGLARHRTGFRVIETSLDGPLRVRPAGLYSAPRQFDAVSGGDDWASLTGALLARLAVGAWQPGTAGTFEGADGAPRGAVSPGLVSFVVEL